MWCAGSWLFYLSHCVSDNSLGRFFVGFVGWGESLEIIYLFMYLFRRGKGFASQEADTNIPALGGPCGRFNFYPNESYYRLKLICSLSMIKSWQDDTASVLNQTFTSASNKTHDRMPESIICWLLLYYQSQNFFKSVPLSYPRHKSICEYIRNAAIDENKSFPPSHQKVLYFVCCSRLCFYMKLSSRESEV